MRQKLFLGPQVRALRLEHGLKLEPCAARLGISVSYLSQIEANQRPVSARVLLAMIKAFEVDASALDADDDQRLADFGVVAADGAAGSDGSSSTGWASARCCRRRYHFDDNDRQTSGASSP